MIEQEFIDRTSRISTLLGIGTALIFASNVSASNKEWWMNAIEEVVYKNNQVPRMPEQSE